MHFKRMLNVVDCHAEGEVGKVIVGGVPNVPGKSMFEKKLYLEKHHDDLRKLILQEPRGAIWHNANIVMPACDPEASMGFVILEATEYPAMSGSNTICVATVLLETGVLPMTEPKTFLTLEAPAGLIRIECDCKNGKVTRVKLVNQPAFCYYLDAKVEVEGLGTISVDVGFGGMTFAFVDAASLGLAIAPSESKDLCELGEKIKKAAADQLSVSYPGNPDMPGITMTQFTGKVEREGDHLFSRNSTIVSPGRCDRSPCGAGSSGRLAVLHARGLIKPGETLIHESIIGSRFECKIESTAEVGPYAAIVPSIAGQGWISGIGQLLLDPTDPYPEGFLLADS